MNPIRIAIADDHKIYREGLKLCLSSDKNLKIISETENGADLLKAIEHHLPDIIIMDLNMPVMDGMEATKIIRKKYEHVKILVVTMYDSEKFVIYLMENGANGYLLKNAEPAEIIKAIYTVHENGYYFNDLVNKILLKSLVTKHDLKLSFNKNIKLTEREQQALKLICEEKTTEEIAQILSLSSRVIEGIRERLIEKVGVRNTAGLVMFAVKNGLTD
ncbi:MAG TPA: response regulator transcription factor [Chitinophagaceae bacterium]|jgi:DNA-binding NarL/FixJ family response regulator